MNETLLLSLQHSYGKAVYEAELSQRFVARLRQEIDAAAQADADLSGFPPEPQATTETQELEQAATFYGIYSHLARSLGVTPQHVRQVARGLHKSKRVSAAISQEIQRLRATKAGLA
jgi:hypothetical protein